MAHILLVDDDKQFQNMMSTMLNLDNHKVTIAQNGEEALQLAKEQHFELIITDILMPVMDGIELITALTKMNYSTPVIALSGGRRTISAEFNLDSASLIGVEATLPKPFTRQELRNAITKALS